jgi:O-antigen ligase
MPILLGFLFYLKKMRYLVYFILSLAALLYTSARSSFLAYVGSITLYLLWIRKYLFLLFVGVLTAVLLLFTGEMTKRILQTLQIKTIFVNLETGQTSIDQKLSTKNLPAGDLAFKIPRRKVPTAAPLSPEEQEKLKLAAIEQAKEMAKSRGESLSGSELQARADQVAKVLQPQTRLLCDISCSTRLQIEWPRAIGHFLYNPFFGTGPSSLGEATDNSYLRWLGEFGLLGTSLFVILLYSIMRYIGRGMHDMDTNKKYIFYGYLFGFFALLINSLYVDAFEASKMAYNFWLVTGFYVGVVGMLNNKGQPPTSVAQSSKVARGKKRKLRKSLK